MRPEMLQDLHQDRQMRGGWSTEDLKLLTIDAGSGYTFAGSVFEPTDFLGLRIRRLGNAAEDTFTQSLYIATSVIFEDAANRL